MAMASHLCVILALLVAFGSTVAQELGGDRAHSSNAIDEPKQANNDQDKHNFASLGGGAIAGLILAAGLGVLYQGFRPRIRMAVRSGGCLGSRREDEAQDQASELGSSTHGGMSA